MASLASWLIRHWCGAGMEKVISRCCGSYVCEPVQEQIGQVLAKIWALKAWLNQPIIRQVQVSIVLFSVAIDCLSTLALNKITQTHQIQ